TLAEIEAADRRGYFIQGDVAQGEPCEAMIGTAVETMGRMDVLVHSAGGPAPGRVDQVSVEDWHQAFDVHIHSCFHLCRAAIPVMREYDEASILLMSSVAGIRGCPGAITYGTVKAAVLHFTRMLARDVADDNIRVNCLAPGIIRTRFHEAMTPEQQQHNLANRISLHREGTSEQVAEAARFLICNDFMTGESITIDGGMSMQVVR
ncbi:MAG: SDR family NAD(P)-dependent oxidoreductase, partial [Planctomycetota bacterium]